MKQRQNAIAAAFKRLRLNNEKALITYIAAGDPDLAATRQLVLQMAASGADLIELGLPYSDPVADGPVIQQASLRALQGGVTTQAVLDLVAVLRQDTEIPLILMAYYNSLLQYGLERFAAAAAAAGVDGLIIPDLPLEESEELRQQTDAHGLDLIMLVAPTTPPARIARVAAASRGFLYCVSVTGVTGTRPAANELQAFLAEVRRQTCLPIAVGFGIATPEQAAAAAAAADGAIVGSAVISVLEQHLGSDTMAAAVGSFTAGLKQALRR
ncbi:MAG: tryptophan synthase subunit alpha [Sporomusaceae bacterium]|nr:tryptophan synthase subunit alpha [Sporomusaceae bacterium]